LLRAKISFASGELSRVADTLWNHPAFATVYPNYLFCNHAVVRASVPVMRAALAAASERPGDPVAAGLVEYLSEHIPEEMHHDDWLLEDIGVLGISATECWERHPPSSVAALVGAQYYWAAHVHPVAVLGYIAVLEGNPPDLEHVSGVAARSGVPLAAFSTLVRHAEIDPFHRSALDQTLDRLPLTDAHASLVGVSAFHTIHWLTRVLQDALAGPRVGRGDRPTSSDRPLPPSTMSPGPR
jgi:hypothetical protein